jgi:GT2 family glycosyltransferase
MTMETVSVVVLAWDQLHYTQRCVEALRQNTSGPLELIIVDNGSEGEAARWAERAADRAVLNPINRGFAAGMNQGLKVASGTVVVFLNNDTEVPPGWDDKLIRTLRSDPRVALVVPAVTSAGNSLTVRNTAGGDVRSIPSFSEPPSAVMYVMDTALAREVGGWSERYQIASGEDWDLCFTLWANDLSVVFDQRVLVEHVGKGTASEKLDDWQTLWRANRDRFLERWTNPIDVPMLASCAPAAFARNLDLARVVAGWMEQFFHTRDRLRSSKAEVRDLQAKVKDLEAKVAAISQPRLTVGTRVRRRIRRLFTAR